MNKNNMNENNMNENDASKSDLNKSDVNKSDVGKSDVGNGVRGTNAVVSDSYEEKADVFRKKFELFVSMLRSSKNIAVFTGAGVSTLSGIPDFRGKHGVYTESWNNLDVEQIISLSFFRKNPDIFYRWAEDVWYCLDDYEPNIVHKTLKLLQDKGYVRNIYTQNIDMLHQKAGSKNVYEIHGSPLFHHCTKCGKQYTYSEVAPVVRNHEVPRCKVCGGVLKPDIVFYEEALNGQVLNSAFRDFSAADLCLVLGSSLLVQPAASLPETAVQSGAKLVIVNAQSTYQDGNASLIFRDLNQTFTALNRWLAGE